jgi:hypothetical protein
MVERTKAANFSLHNTVRNSGETLLTINKIQLTIIPVCLTTKNFSIGISRCFSCLWSFAIAGKIEKPLEGGHTADDKVLILCQKEAFVE